uniref:VLIG-type G domain-containing protein n=1 Tax=Pyxicephalus adspersus TaxID=30357 RepID=A0AAV3A3N8_PYXAD|nr:TPA: hypothetical protein GDO54_014870 [Pyxicephalus adspersus]
MDSNACNPLDVLCDVLHDSDTFFQQEIVTKFSMCQFALPLLLPAGDGSHHTFMLWSIRDIVKKWKPLSLVDSRGFMEENLVSIPMSIFSFVRLGKCSLSKSKLLNQVLSPSEFIHNFFVHRDMPGGNVQRKHSDGLVEMSCYFPSGTEHSDIFPDPVSVFNLRGDLEDHLKQFDFLLRVSSAVFVFLERIDHKQYGLLSEWVSRNPKLFFIVNLGNGKSDTDILEYLKNLSTTQNLKKDKFIVKTRQINDTQVVRTLQAKINTMISNTEEKPTLEQIGHRAAELNFNIDEKFEKCEKAKNAAMEIISAIKNLLDYKKETMKLQGDLWKQLAKCEKEMCRMRKLEDKDVEEYKALLRGEIVNLRQLQSQQTMAYGVRQFVQHLQSFSPVERKIYLKWMKIELDKLGRYRLAKVNREYRKLLANLTLNLEALTEIDQKLADGSLGVEHFIRELGQFYEVECSIGKEKTLSSFPTVAADLLLDGFPMELIDGDASNIPMQVITVLGVQSTGKSTLLNTMFGLQLPTSSGRCTRGAFMTLLDTKKNFEEDLGCDYVIVIDTEGLKSMELASLEGSYEHDNELATVVVGLSDVTIVNMAMENTEEMKDILQIVIHAFLRMKEVGKKSSCHFVHQNVSDVSAYLKNRKAREKFIEQLNEMTKVSARMEKKGCVTGFSDIMHCDMERNSWYIPGLWQGIPPMASINKGYSETVQELKKSIAEYLKSMPGKPQDIKQLTDWIRSLWNAVKHEKFVFSFRNRLLGSKTGEKIQRELNSLMEEEGQIMARYLEKYFRDDCDNAHVLEMFKGDFSQSIKHLKKNLEIVLLGKCKQAIQMQQEKCLIQAVQERYISIIEERVAEIMNKIRNDQNPVNAEQLHRVFEIVWEKVTSTLPPPKRKKRNIDLEIVQQLKQDLQCDESSVIQKLSNLTNLHQDNEEEFSMNGKYLQTYSRREWASAEDLAISVIRKCNERTTKLFELDLKLCVLRKASETFRRIHEDFIRSNEPRSYLDEMKPQYFSIFNNMFVKRNECQRRAKQFCMVCLKPAITDHINRSLGKEIMDDILQKNGPQEFKSRQILQQQVLKALLVAWISQYLTKHYKGRDTIHTMQVRIMESLILRIKQALHEPKSLQAGTIAEFLAKLCNVLKKELVISQNSTKVVIFQSNLSDIRQFAHDIESYLPDLEKLVLQEMNSMNRESIFLQLTLNPQDELFTKGMGCGMLCPFCKAPCEAGGGEHKEHFASVHRPRGLSRHVNEETCALDHSICSSNVISNKSFRNADTEGKLHPYQDYQKYYPDWAIYPDTTSEGSDYWKFVLKEFNSSFAGLYNARPANVPEDWHKITRKQAQKSLEKTLQ